MPVGQPPSTSPHTLYVLADAWHRHREDCSQAARGRIRAPRHGSARGRGARATDPRPRTPAVATTASAAAAAGRRASPPTTADSRPHETPVPTDPTAWPNAPAEMENTVTAPRRALIVIDAQQEYFNGSLPIQYPDPNTSIDRIRAAIDAADQAGIPVVLVQHELPADAPVFATGSAAQHNHPDVAAYEQDAAKRIGKQYSSVFEQTGLEQWLRDHDIETVTLAGYMTNNCVIASAAAAEPLGFTVEVLSDATGAIDLVNDAGRVPAQQVYETLMALLHSNWASVTDTHTWEAALRAGETLPNSDLVTSAAQGRAPRD